MLFCNLSNAKENELIRRQESCCIFCGMQSVAFHSTFPSLLARNSYACWGSFEDISKISSDIFQLLHTFPNSFDHVCKFSDNFPTLPKILKDFSKISNIVKAPQKKVLKRFKIFWKFPNIYKLFRKFPYFFRRFRHEIKQLPKGSCVYRIYK